jgi:hypothetical protein
MTKAQAVAMNHRFLSMDSTIKAYDEAYKYKYFQYDQARKELAVKDSVINELNRQLRIKPTFKKVTQTDIFVGSFFVGFSTLMGILVL